MVLVIDRVFFKTRFAPGFAPQTPAYHEAGPNLLDNIFAND